MPVRLFTSCGLNNQKDRSQSIASNKFVFPLAFAPYTIPSLSNLVPSGIVTTCDDSKVASSVASRLNVTSFLKDNMFFKDISSIILFSGIKILSKQK